MSIVRIQHNKENPYVVINKEALWDQGLSLEAVGLWARLLSRPDNWHINVIELSRSCKTSKYRIYQVLKELIEGGYALRIQKMAKTMSGKKVKQPVEYVVFEFKVNEEFKKSFLLLDSQRAETQRAENQSLLSNEREPSIESPKSTKYLKEEEQPEAAPPLASPVEKFKNRFGDKLKIRDKQIDGLLKDFGEEVVTVVAADVCAKSEEEPNLLLRNHGILLRQWCRLRQRWDNPPNIERNKMVAELTLASLRGDLRSDCYMQIHDHYVEFGISSLNWSEKVYFKDPEEVFRNQIAHFEQKLLQASGYTNG